MMCGSKLCSGFINLLKNNLIYRRTFLLTLATCFTYVMLGWVELQYGTALPDLMHLIRVDLEAASWLFTVRSFGVIGGSLLFGVFYDKFNRLLIMCICSLGMALCTLLTPYLLWYPTAMVLRICTGIFCGGVDTGCNTIVPSIWGSDGAPYMQALYVSYALGGIVSPFVTEPFMAPKQVIKSPVIRSGSVPLYNLSLSNTTNTFAVFDTFKNSSNAYVIEDRNRQTNNKIYICFIITTVAVLLSCIPYAVMCVNGEYDIKACKKEKGCSDQKHETEKLNKNSESDNAANDDDIQVEIVNRKQLSKYRLGLVLLCIAMVNLIYSGAEECIGAYIVTFCLDYLDWETVPSATLSSLYWITSFVGGLSGIVLVQILTTTKLLYLANFIWIVTSIGAVFGSLYHVDKLIWLCIQASGFFTVQIVPATFSWIEENVSEVTGRISTIIMVATGIGLTLNPLLVGYTMQTYSYVSFMYILVGESIACVLFYGMAHAIG